jgi:carboxymethylenebutenolidase
VRITLPTGTAAELARPDSGAQVDRGLVIVPDIGSIRPLFDEMCARLAAENGWAVCAFDVWPAARDHDLEWRLANAGTRRDAEVLGDAVAAADVTGAEKVSVIGFCMGGMYTLKAAGTGRFWRAAAFYGMIRLPDHWRSDTQGDPLDALASPKRCPTMAIIGGKDTFTPAPDVADLEAAGVEVVRYPDAEHGFVHDPSRPAHRASDAADAWARVLAFLSQ